MSDQITPIIETLRTLCHPTAEALSDRSRLDAFVKAGNEAADALEQLWLRPEALTEKWARQREAAKQPSQFNSADWEAFDGVCPHCGTLHNHANAPCGGDRVLRQPRRPLTHPE
jgi:hypothetical protein